MDPCCRRLKEQLGDFLEGELSAELCIELEQHLEGCPDCRVVVDTTRLTIRIYRGQELYAEVPPEVERRLLDCLRQRLT